MDLPTRTMMTLIAMTAKSDRDAVSRLQKIDDGTNEDLRIREVDHRHLIQTATVTSLITVAMAIPLPHAMAVLKMETNRNHQLEVFLT